MRAALAAAAALAALALALPALAANEPPKTIRVVSVATSLKNHDKPPKGSSKGDTSVMKDRLLNAVAQFGKKKGAVVGTDSGKITVLGPHSARFDGIAHLPGGTLTLKGRIAAGPNGSIVIPVTAGTGRYAGAHGAVLVGPGSKRSVNVYVLEYRPVA